MKSDPDNCVDISGKVLGSRPRNRVKTSKRDLLCLLPGITENPIPALEKAKQNIQSQNQMNILKTLLADGSKKLNHLGEIVDRSTKMKEESWRNQANVPTTRSSNSKQRQETSTSPNQLFLQRKKGQAGLTVVKDEKSVEQTYLRSRAPGKDVVPILQNLVAKNADPSKPKRLAESVPEQNSTKPSETPTLPDSRPGDIRQYTRSGRASVETAPKTSKFEVEVDTQTGVNRTRSKSIKKSDPEVPSKILKKKNPFCVSRPSAVNTPQSSTPLSDVQRQMETLTLGKRTPDLHDTGEFTRSSKKYGFYRPQSKINDEDVFLSDGGLSPLRHKHHSRDSSRDKSLEKPGLKAEQTQRSQPKKPEPKKQITTVAELPPHTRPLSECLKEMMPTQRYIDTVQDVAKGKVPQVERFVDLDKREDSDTVAEILTLISANLQSLNQLTESVKSMNEDKALDAVLAQALIETANRSQLKRVLEWIQQVAGIQYKGKKLVKEQVLLEAEKRLGLRLKKPRNFSAQQDGTKQTQPAGEVVKEVTQTTSKIVAEEEADEPPGTLLSILGNVGDLAPSTSKVPQPLPEPAEEDISLMDLWQATQ